MNCELANDRQEDVPVEDVGLGALLAQLLEGLQQHFIFSEFRVTDIRHLPPGHTVFFEMERKQIDIKIPDTVICLNKVSSLC